MKDIQTNLKITEGYFPRLFMIFFCMLWTLGLFAQSTREVKGVVKDPTGETVIGASVLEKGTTNGTITDFDGNFVLTVSENAVLQISYIGYQTQEISVKGKKNLVVTLKEDTEVLEEVVVVGYGATSDAHHLTAPIDDGSGDAKAIEFAIKDAGIRPEDIDYINVHGTSTPVGDVSEVKAIKDVFGDHAYKLNISSTKSMTGHLLGAAGAVEAIASVLAVKNDIVPPTINHEEGDNDENIDYNLNFTFNEAQKRTVNAALSNTFGFGGHNACVIVKKYAE